MTATRDNNRSGRVPAGAAMLQADVTEAIRQAFLHRTRRVQCQLSAQWIAPELNTPSSTSPKSYVS
jgi:hypothetical protein